MFTRVTLYIYNAHIMKVKTWKRYIMPMVIESQNSYSNIR